MLQFSMTLDWRVGVFWGQFARQTELGGEISPLLKIGLFFTVWLGVWVPILIPLAWRWRWYPSRPLTPPRKLTLVGSLYVLFPLPLWGLTELTGVSFWQYGPLIGPQSLSWLSLGLAIGIFTVMILVAVQRIAGWISWNLNWTVRDGLRQFLLALVLGIWIAGVEELIFRGLVQQELQRELSVWSAAGLTSLIFALLHLIWQPRQTLPQLPGLWLMGLVLTQACLFEDGSLSLAWGLHGGWVCALIWLDSSDASQPRGTVPPWVTGVGGHPLAGMVGLVLLAVVGGLLGLRSFWMLAVNG
ncbi:MAG: CPBP family intramembrane glutamic endopeptidase [Sodalinema sp.]|uniref:CPBP family intramembrane glutamic endopeptidase n=1 Tax=Sodalinema sp. TaxID=3080550 RepID=UPI0011F6E218|nr:MAG: CPBP family intramembrane metalloprotease [Phormidium sp. SL48-SHIP]